MRHRLFAVLIAVCMIAGCGAAKGIDGEIISSEMVTEVTDAAEETTIPEVKEESVFEERTEIPEFEGTWNEEANRFLAYIAANIGGSEREKQNAVIDALEAAWDGENSIRLIEWIEQNYELYYEPGDRDYELVELVKNGTWAEE